jgi:hypothetical protein
LLFNITLEYIVYGGPRNFGGIGIEWNAYASGHGGGEY